MINSDKETTENTNPNIRAIHAFNTGSAAQHKEHRYGSKLPRLWWVLTSRSWIRIPINVFLIEHKDGLVLFDTGLDPAITSDRNYILSTIGRFLLKRIFRLDIGPQDGLGHKLNILGYDGADIGTAVISHLHFDHIGGISDIPNADLLINRKEWDQLSKPHPEHDWVLREHIEFENARWRQIDFSSTEDPILAPFETCHDVMGDGSIILLPTPGHTPGSLSMLIRSDIAPPVLLVGDMAYDVEAIFSARVPGTGDAKQLRQSYAKVRQLKSELPDLIIVPSHDGEAVRALMDATRDRSIGAGHLHGG